MLTAARMHRFLAAGDFIFLASSPMPREFPEDPTKDKPLRAGLAFCGEYLVPGGSHLVQGDLKGAAVHGVLGLTAGMLFGFPARLLFSSNSLRTALRRPATGPTAQAAETPAAAAQTAETVPQPSPRRAPRQSSTRQAPAKTQAKASAAKPTPAAVKKPAGSRSRKSTS